MGEMLFMKNNMSWLGESVLICLGGMLMLALAGCGPNKQELAKQVLEKDPKFGQVLQKKSEVDTQILEIEEEFKGVRTKVEAEIAKLNQELVELYTRSLKTSDNQAGKR